MVVSALLGGRAAIVFAHDRAPTLFGAYAVRDEIGRWLPKLAARRRLDLGLRLAIFQALPIQWIEPDRYRGCEEEARRRMRHRDEDDWPTVALALSLCITSTVAVSTQDKDYAASGVPTLTTGELLDSLAAG